MVKEKRKIRRKSDFFITGSFLMTLIISLLVGYNQLQQKYQDERWNLLKNQIERVEEKIDKLFGFITDCKLKIQSNSEKADNNFKKIASWDEFAKRFFLRDDKDESKQN